MSLLLILLLLLGTGVMHKVDNTYSISSTWQCCQQVQFLTAAYYKGKHYIFVTKQILLWMCPFDSIVFWGVELE